MTDFEDLEKHYDELSESEQEQVDSLHAEVQESRLALKAVEQALEDVQNGDTTVREYVERLDVIEDEYDTPSVL
jgi:histidinol dehydrogenase